MAESRKKIAMKLLRACGYFRVSRYKGEDHLSLETQRELFLNRCKEKDYEVGGEYIDTESGRKATRRGYQQLLRDIREGEYDVIVVRDVSRFGRDHDEITVRVSEVKQLGMKVDAILSAATEEMGEPLQFLMRAIETFLASNEVLVTRGRSQEGVKAAVKKGRHQGRVPYGYRREDGNLHVIDHEAAVIRDIFRWYVTENMSLKGIARRLNLAGVRPRFSLEWSPETVRIILLRPAYMGTWTWGEHTEEDGCPPIVSEDQWKQAQARMVRKAGLPPGRTQTSPNLLTGLLFCGHCKGPMYSHASVQRENGKTYRQRGYVCGAWKKSQLCPSNASNYHNADKLERVVITALSQGLQQRPETAPEPRAGGLHTERDSVAQRLDKTAAVLRRNMEERDLFASPEQFAEANTMVEQDRAGLRLRLAQLDKEIRIADAEEAQRSARPERMETLVDYLNNPNPQQAKGILQDYVERIEICNGEQEPTIWAR